MRGCPPASAGTRISPTRHLANIADTYDAAVLSKDARGKVKIIHKHEQPKIQGGGAGLVMGLAVGAIAALFPAVTIGAGLLAGGAAGTALGAVSGHVVAGMSRSDLKDLGEALDAGTFGLVIVAAEDAAARIDTAINRGSKIMKKELRHDEKALKDALNETLVSA